MQDARKKLTETQLAEIKARRKSREDEQRKYMKDYREVCRMSAIHHHASRLRLADCVIEYLDLDATDDTKYRCKVKEFLENCKDDFDSVKTLEFVNSLLTTSKYEYNHAMFETLDIQLVSIAVMNDENQIELIDLQKLASLVKD